MIGTLQSINTGAPSTAISGAWAAIETLLYSPGYEERVAAGERQARIVACSFPRAELTHLSYKVDPMSALGTRIRSHSQNKDRACELALAIERGDPVALTDPADFAALDRLSKISTSPHKTLSDVVEYASAAFRRLYRCRNLILHWGRVEGEIRRACLRTTAPLVGAGVDRIAHASLIENLSPLALASRAHAGLREIRSGGADLVDLLE